LIQSDKVKEVWVKIKEGISGLDLSYCNASVSNSGGTSFNTPFPVSLSCQIIGNDSSNYRIRLRTIEKEMKRIPSS
jgi:hypothetical protein